MFDEMLSIETIATPELCDQCLALTWAINELVDPMLRDTLNWILLERLQHLNQRFSDVSEVEWQP